MAAKALIVIVFTLAISLPRDVRAENTVPLAVEDAINVRGFGQFMAPAKFSPDGIWLAFVVSNNRKMISSAFSEERYARTGVLWDAIGVDIWVLNLKNGVMQNLTQGNGNNWFPAWSPDGRYLAFLSDRGDSTEARLWIWEPASNGIKQVSCIGIRTGQEMQWLPDGRGLLVSILPENAARNDDAKLTVDASDRGKEPGPAVPTVTVYRSGVSFADGVGATPSDPWRLGGHPVDLAVLDLSTGDVHRVVRNLDRLGWYVLSPDGSRFTMTRSKRFEKPGTQQVLWDIEVSSITSGETHVVVPDVRLSYGGASLSWSPDSLRLAYLTGGPLDKNKDCYVLDPIGGPPRNITMFPADGMTQMQRPPVWDADNKRIYFVRGGIVWRAASDQTRPAEFAIPVTSGVEELVTGSDGRFWSPDAGASVIALTRDRQTKKSAFYRIDLATRSTTKLSEDNNCHTCINALQHAVGTPGGSAVAYFSEDAQHAADLWLTDPSFRTPRQLTHLNPQLENYQMGRARLISWASDDGSRLQGALLLPAGYAEGTRYPMIVWVYGGESLSDHVDRFGLGQDGPFNLQLFATRGYVVLLPDMPQRLGTPMLDVAKVVLPGISKVVEMGIADPDRIGVIGHSYGGYCTLTLIVQSRRFSAAVISGGYGDLMGQYGQMSATGAAFGMSIDEHGQGLIGGTPWEFRERYVENSPIFYLDRVGTPLLILQGANDSTVASFLADEVFVDLRRLGNEVEYAKYAGEEHSPIYWDYSNQVDFCNRMIHWFDSHLKKGSP